MKLIAACVALTVCVLAASAGGPPDDPAVGSTNAGQSVADLLKSFANADGVLIPAGLISQPLQKNDLATILTYPDDNVEVLDLTGAQLRQAFERSALLFPQPNVGFLQVAGFEITFSKKASPNSRVTGVTVNGSKLEDGHTYTVAMPSSLQRGQLGYSNLWDKAKIVHSFKKTTLRDVLKGKHVSQSSPRWVAQD